MADKKISQLTSLAQGDIATTTDVLAIVDTSATETKKATPAAIVGAAAAAGLTNVDINSGAIDGTAIGANSASTGAFTTLSASGSVTLSGGTANGVLYLNGSKVATSGSVVTFDGAKFAMGSAASHQQFDINLSTGGPSWNFGYIRLGSLSGDMLTWGGGASAYADVVTLKNPTNNPLVFGVNNTEQMRLTSTGLGIGTSSPVGKLQVTGSLASFILNTSGTEFYNNYAGQVKIYASNASGFLSFGASGRDNDVVLSTAGNLGIGTSSPAVPLDVVSNSGSNGINIRARSSNDYGFLNFKSNDGSDTAGSIAALRAGVNSGSLLFYTGTTEKARLDTSGNLGIGTSSPAAKLSVDSGSSALNANFNSTNASGIYVRFQNSGTSIGDIGGGASVVSGGTAGDFAIASRSGNLVLGTGSVTRATLDASGNLGLGVTPSAWSGGGTARAIQIGNYSSLFSNAAGNTSSALTHNAYFDGTNWRYLATSVGATRYEMTGANAGSTHSWSVSAGGTAGNSISFTQAMTLDASGNLLVGTTSSGWAASGRQTVEVNGSSSALVGLRIATALSGYMFHDGTDMGVANSQNGYLRFITNNTERARITAGGDFLVGQTAQSVSTVGASLLGTGEIAGCVSGSTVLFVNRKVDDGTLVDFRQADIQEGTISVSGNTVSYNAFAGSHWSQLQDGSKPDILRGTVMESINELCVWPGENNERLPKAKISDTAGSKKVYGVFMAWDNDWTETNDMYVTAVGAFICRVNGSVTVQEGDLLESNGDGTARVQADDIIRSSTIGKVTSTVKTHQYDDGSYCVPTVLYCG